MEKTNDRKKVIQRLKRIEGQVRGIQKMIEDEKYCIDVLTQIAAARAALDKVGLAVFEEHSQTCLIQAMEENSSEALEDLMQVLKRFMK